MSKSIKRPILLLHVHYSLLGVREIIVERAEETRDEIAQRAKIYNKFNFLVNFCKRSDCPMSVKRTSGSEKNRYNDFSQMLSHFILIHYFSILSLQWIARVQSSEIRYFVLKKISPLTKHGFSLPFLQYCSTNLAKMNPNSPFYAFKGQMNSKMIFYILII